MSSWLGFTFAAFRVSDRQTLLWNYFRLPVTRAQSDTKAESSQHFASPKSCDVHSSAVKILDHPFSFQRDFSKAAPSAPPT